jgi:acetate kinase
LPLSDRSGDELERNRASFMKILVMNAGSSSQKSCLYDLTELTGNQPPKPVWEALVDWTHSEGAAELKIKTAKGAVLQETRPAASRLAVTNHMLETLWQGDTKVIEKPAEIDVVGHRVVHGGQDYDESVIVTDEVMQAIDRLSALAPVHNPVNLEGIRAIDQILPDVPQVAVFDTAFHAKMPAAAAIYPVPYEWSQRGIRRYGFHGTSHRYCAHRAADLLGRDVHTLKMINCHLGNGCSLAAIQNGCSVDTTMGFTPLDGLMMGTRSGSVDPGMLIHLLRQEGYSADDLNHILNEESGFKGVSGVSADLRQISAAIAKGNEQAKLAFDIFIHRLQTGIGAMVANLGGLDVLIFTAGVGENAADVRAAACEPFAFMGLKLDAEKNQQRPVDQDVAAADSTVRIFVIHTQEDWAIAQECIRLMKAAV